MKKIIDISKCFALCVAMLMFVSFTAYAQSNNNFKVSIGGVEMDIEQIALQNGVNPYELKAAIENQSNSEKSSPFSSLISTKRMPTSLTKISVSKNPIVAAAAATTVSKSNEDSTAYVAASTAQTASGKTPKIGMAAMNIDVTTKTGSTTSSVVKMGTVLSLTKSISINGSSYSSLTVEDRGSPKNRTTYWVDIFFGENNTTNYQAAINYGVKSISYSWTY